MLPQRIMWILPSILVSLIHIQPTTAATIDSGLLLFPAQNLTDPSPGSLVSNISPSNPLCADKDAQCHRITEPSMPGLNPTNCELAAFALCRDMKPQTAPRDRWVWNEQVGCATGYYISDEFFYTVFLCEASFKEIIATCATDSRFNAGSLNVQVLPDFTQAGEAQLENQPMYIMAPERLTL